MPSADREAIRASLLSLIDSLSAATVIIVPPSGPPQTFQLPSCQPALAPDTDCTADVLYILGEALGRLTTQQILAALEQAGLLHGEITVKRSLAKLVKDKRISNHQGAVPRGYALGVTQEDTECHDK